MEFTEKENIPGILIFIDFKKQWLDLLTVFWPRLTTVFFGTRAILEKKHQRKRFQNFRLALRAIERSDQNPLVTATSVTFRPSLRHASGL